MEDFLIDFSKEADKRHLWAFLKACKGKWRFEACRYHPRRTDAQNRYYHGVIVKLFADYLRENGDVENAEIAHEILKSLHLQLPIVREGEIIGHRTGSTAKLSTSEFIEYNDRCIVWLADFFHIVVPDPGQYYTREASRV